jgi:hypothetical protein
MHNSQELLLRDANASDEALVRAGADLTCHGASLVNPWILPAGLSSPLAISDGRAL